MVDGGNTNDVHQFPLDASWAGGVKSSRPLLRFPTPFRQEDVMRIRSATRSWSRLGRFLACIAIAGLVWVGCSEVSDQPTAPATPSVQGSDNGALPSKLQQRVLEVMAVQDRHTSHLMQLPDVVGTATGLDAAGAVVIKVYTERQVAASSLPAELDGVPV